MKTTNFKDSVKVNQILPIMQEHFGKNMNLARIKLMALLLHALCVVQTVSLHKLADAMPQHYVLSVSLFIIFSYKMFFGL